MNGEDSRDRYMNSEKAAGRNGTGRPMNQMLQCFFAPMEGITGYVYRNAHHKWFPHLTGYFTPFLSPNQSRRFSSRELNDVLPEHNRGIDLVPQILTNRPEDFIFMAEELQQMGYEKVNLNLGCPSGTVVSKCKGAGFLAKKEELNSFLYQVCSRISIGLSVKTRLGLESAAEFYGLLEIFNRYPLEELIIHPRVRSDFYKNTPDLKLFQEALVTSKNPVWYNGDLVTAADIREFQHEFPEVEAVMLGRGLVANPGLAEEWLGHGRLYKTRLKEFHDALYEGYRKTISGDRNVLFKMKEVWSYLLTQFTDSKKHGKRIRKAERAADYEAAVAGLFLESELIADGVGETESLR